jgi:hypothetical protein
VTDVERDREVASAALVPLDAPPVGDALPVAEVVERASQTALGFALLLGDGVRAVARQVAGPAAFPDHPDDEPGPWTVGRRVALGVATDVQHRVLGLTGRAVNAVVPTVGRRLSGPVLRPLARPLRTGLGRAYEVGLERERAARALASRTGEETVSLAVPVVLDAVDLQPVIEGVLQRVDLQPLIDDVLGGLELGPVVSKVIADLDLKPVVDRVLEQLDLPSIVESVMGEIDLAPIVQQVLDQLDLPALVDEVVGEIRMSSVVLQATGGITEDVVGGLRDRSADGDALVERIVARVLRRRVDELPPPGIPGPVGGPQDPS